MARGRRRWRGDREEEACPRRIHRFLEPCLILLLHCNEAHGYELLDGLKQFGFDRNPVDSGKVYRILRDLEEVEAVKVVGAADAETNTTIRQGG